MGVSGRAGGENCRAVENREIINEKNGERLVGFNTENQEINEGLVRFDIVFYAGQESVIKMHTFKTGIAENMKVMYNSDSLIRKHAGGE